MAEIEIQECSSQVEDTRKKISTLSAKLEKSFPSVIGVDSLIEIANELEKLAKWRADAGEDQPLLQQKLHQLERIQNELETSARESDLIHFQADYEDSSFSIDSQPHQIHLLDVEQIEWTSYGCGVSNTKESSAECKTGKLVDIDVSESECYQISNKGKRENFLDSLVLNVSEDEGLGDESRREDLSEIRDSLSSYPHNINKAVLIGGEREDSKREYCKNESSSSLDICFYVIESLRESLRAKENEFSKLSRIQNDKKQVGDLEDNDSINLKMQLEFLRKENGALKEQVLELEEAENDARLQSQLIEEKLMFLQEKDLYFQTKLSETKNALDKSLEKLTLKEQNDKDLKAQLKYAEVLVQKYEDQIKILELNEMTLHEKIIENEAKLTALLVKEKVNRGTQVYDTLKEKTNQYAGRKDASIQTNEERTEKICMLNKSVQTYYNLLRFSSEACLGKEPENIEITDKCFFRKEFLQHLQDVEREELSKELLAFPLSDERSVYSDGLCPVLTQSRSPKGRGEDEQWGSEELDEPERGRRLDGERDTPAHGDLQLRPNRAQEELRLKLDDLEARLNDSKSTQIKKETRLQTEMESLRKKNLLCDQMIQHFHSKYDKLLKLLNGNQIYFEKSEEWGKKSLKDYPFTETGFKEHRGLMNDEMYDDTKFHTDIRHLRATEEELPQRESCPAAEGGRHRVPAAEQVDEPDYAEIDCIYVKDHYKEYASEPSRRMISDARRSVSPSAAKQLMKDDDEEYCMEESANKKRPYSMEW